MGRQRPHKQKREIDPHEANCVWKFHELTKELHVCPLRSELYDDKRPHCACCASCQYQCEMDV